QNPGHSYTDPGNYTVTLIASDGINYDTISQVIQIGSGVPFTYVIENELEVAFTSNNVNPIYEEWDFGDGNTDFGSFTNTTYSGTGCYDVVLTAQMVNGCNIESVQPVCVSKKGEISIYPNPIRGSYITIDNPGWIYIWADIYDEVGQLTLEVDLTREPEIVQKDISFLGPGLYFFRFIKVNGDFDVITVVVIK
ncbi:MAG: hypothetical protein IH948_09465, partial [Bacteroidetes bacterium]|nr:hypothetical protein [Bacteroidota bacterium]